MIPYREEKGKRAPKNYKDGREWVREIKNKIEEKGYKEWRNGI